MKIQIKNHFNDVVIFEGEFASIKEAVSKAVNAGIPLYGADLCCAVLCYASLRGADLRGTYLRDADLRGVVK